MPFLSSFMSTTVATEACRNLLNYNLVLEGLYSSMFLACEITGCSMEALMALSYVIFPASEDRAACGLLSHSLITYYMT